MRIRRTILARTFIAVCSALLPVLTAQVPFGELHIEVKDPSGAAVQQASGSLHDIASGADRRFETNSDGAYTFQRLPAGRYRLDVSKPGFSTQSLTLEIRSAAPVSRVITLTLGSSTTTMNVVAATPLGGTGLSLQEIPAPVQTLTRQELDNSGALDLSDFLNRRLSGVNINENQENPFQPDLNYRGYTASPLLGTPEGISVYMDGVRLNQPFGDIVAWDLIPKVAISEMALIPGSDPLFGLNTLGGAISIQTKDGRSAPGAAL